MHFKNLIFISMLGLLMARCSLMPNEIKIAEQMMITHPDSALQILRNVKSVSSLPDADHALYGLLMFKALDKNNLPLQPDSLLNFSILYYQKNVNNDALSYCYFYKARMYKMVQRHEEAAVLYLKSLDELQKSENFELLGKIYADLGDISTYQRELKDARKKYQISLEYFTRANIKSEIYNRLLDIGRSYHLAKEYRTAQNFYNKVLHQANDSVLCGAALQEIGINFYWELKLDSAEFYLRKSLDYPYESTNYAIRLYTLADVNFDMGNFDNARKYALKSLDYPANFFTKRDCYRILSNSEYKMNNFQLMGKYIAKYQDCVDSVRKIEVQTKSTFLENLHETKLAANKTRNYLTIVGWVLPIIALVSLLLVYRARKRNKQNEQVLVQEINQKRTQIIQSKSHLKASLLQKIDDTRAMQMPAFKKASLLQRDEMTKELYAICLHTNNWDEFSSLMNSTFNNVMTTLENKFPELNRKELMWCGLYLVDLDANDISLVLDTKLSSLYKLKQRLAQKMNLKTSKEFEAFLDQMINAE